VIKTRRYDRVHQSEELVNFPASIAE